MKRTQQLLAAAVLSSASAVATAAPIVINFDVDGLGNVIAAGTSITNQYANLGVLFAGLEDGAAATIIAQPDPDGAVEPSAPNTLTNCSGPAGLGCAGNRADIVRITFDGPVFDISLMLDSLGGQSVTFNLYDAADALLETVSVTSGGSVFVPVAFTAGNVSRIDGLQPNDGWAWAMDDLTFTVSAVPEPATLALLGLGLAGMGWARKRTAS